MGKETRRKKRHKKRRERKSIRSDFKHIGNGYAGGFDTGLFAAHSTEAGGVPCIFTVVSGSMEPAIPTGSLVYIKGIPPEDVAEEEVIAFYGARDGASIITHRVVANSVEHGTSLSSS